MPRNNRNFSNIIAKSLRHVFVALRHTDPLTFFSFVQPRALPFRRDPPDDRQRCILPKRVKRHQRDACEVLATIAGRRHCAFWREDLYSHETPRTVFDGSDGLRMFCC